MKSVEGEAPNSTTHSVELAVDRVVVPEPVELVQAASELADARQVGVVRCEIGHLSLPGVEPEPTSVQHFRPTSAKCSPFAAEQRLWFGDDELSDAIGHH